MQILRHNVLHLNGESNICIVFELNEKICLIFHEGFSAVVWLSIKDRIFQFSTNRPDTDHIILPF